MTDRSHATNRQAWIERIERYRHARQTVAEFCAAEGVSPASFYQWRRKLQSDTSAIPPTKFVPVQLTSAPPTEPVTVMSVELPGGVRVRLEVTGAAAVQP